MRLYKATYDWTTNTGQNQASLYILAPDFQTASKLAETNSKISGPLRAAGDVSSSLSQVELIASDVIQE